MPLNTILRRASSLLGLGQPEVSSIVNQDGEVVFCKNNVCVHPPTMFRFDGEVSHHPGYLSIRSQPDDLLGATLVLSWIPNSTLKKNPRSVENRTPGSSPCRSAVSSALPSPCPTPRHWSSSSLNQQNTENIVKAVSDEIDTTQPECEFESLGDDINSLDSFGHNETDSRCGAEAKDVQSVKSQCDSGIGTEDVSENKSEDVRLIQESCPQFVGEVRESGLNISIDGDSLVVSQESSRGHVITITSDTGTRKTPDSDNSLATGGTISVLSPEDDISDFIVKSPDSGVSMGIVSDKIPEVSCKQEIEVHQKLSDDQTNLMVLLPEQRLSEDLATVSSPFWLEGTPESFALHHNLSFPETVSLTSSMTASPIRREHRCGLFSVDLGQMRSFRLFFNNKDNTCGQLVIASRESQYKILHFHYGGLDKLATVLEEWNFIERRDEKCTMKERETCPYKQFLVCRPEVSAAELHPEEDLHGSVDLAVWTNFLGDDGVVEDEIILRKMIFFAGIDQEMRREIWPFLLHYFSFQSTFEEREVIRNERHSQYLRIQNLRENLSSEERKDFWRNIQCTVEKDVIRTDRTNPFFAGEDNENVITMKNILLNYAVYNKTMGYMQGMSDLVAPLLAEMQDEIDTFWCFVGLMQKTIFVTSPTDLDMDTNLESLRELIRLMLPSFYEHLKKHEDGLDLLFCHRWILLCFKREFQENDALKIWEACWSHYQTDYFHLFICVAILSIYGSDLAAQGLRPDELLLHFSSLAMHMNGDLVLRKARGLLHQFRQLRCIPCSLATLCDLCGPGMWDSGHVPTIECVGGHVQQSCPFGGL